MGLRVTRELTFLSTLFRHSAMRGWFGISRVSRIEIRRETAKLPSGKGLAEEKRKGDTHINKENRGENGNALVLPYL